MALKQTLPIPAETAIATYNYTDIAEGTGIVSFFLFSEAIEGTTTYNLLTNALYSTQIELTRSSDGDTTFNFDTPKFNLPRTVRGTAYYTTAFRVTSTGTMKVQARLKKWDGSSETNISDNITSITISGDNQGMFLMKIPITTPTIIKKGDLIRLTIILTRGNGAGIAAIGNDPKNRDATQLTPTTQQDLVTISGVHIPFKLDI